MSGTSTCTITSTSSVCVGVHGNDFYAEGVIFILGILLFLAGGLTWKILTDKIS